MEIARVGKDEIELWTPNGKGSVMVRLRDHTEVVFTFERPNRWAIKSVDYYLNEGRKK